MSIAYLAAEDEIFGVANTAWNEIVSSVGLSYAPKLFFPGQIVPAPPVTNIYAECSFSVVKEQQASLAKVDGVSIYETVGLFALQIRSPKSDSEAMRIAKQIGSAVNDAFCKQSPSGEIWFRDQRLTPVAGNTTENQINVVVTCNYRTAK